MIWEYIYKLFCICYYFVDVTRNVKYKGKQNYEKIQRVTIRLALGSYVIKLCKWDQKITY